MKAYQTHRKQFERGTYWVLLATIRATRRAKHAQKREKMTE